MPRPLDQEQKPLIRPRNIIIALVVVIALALGSYGYYLANMGGYLPWQEDPTPIANSITPFSGVGFENLPTIPPKRAAASPAASPNATPVSSPAATSAA